MSHRDVIVNCHIGLQPIQEEHFETEATEAKQVLEKDPSMASICRLLGQGSCNYNDAAVHVLLAGRQVVDHTVLVLVDTVVTRLKVSAETVVIVKPPECGTRKEEEAGATRAELL